MPTAHRPAPAEADALQADRVFVAEAVGGEGEADDTFVADGDDATAEAPLLVEG